MMSAWWLFVIVPVATMFGYCVCGLLVSNREDSETMKWKRLAEAYHEKINGIQAAKLSPHPEAREEDIGMDELLQVCADYCRLGTDGHLHMQRGPIEQALRAYASRLAAPKPERQDICPLCAHSKDSGCADDVARGGVKQCTSFTPAAPEPHPAEEPR